MNKINHLRLGAVHTHTHTHTHTYSFIKRKEVLI